MLQRPLLSLLASDTFIIIIIITILFQVHPEKDKDLCCKAQTAPCTSLTDLLGADSALGCPACSHPTPEHRAVCLSVCLRAAHPCWPPHLSCWHPAGLRMKRRIPPCLSLCQLHAHSPAIPKPPRRRCHQWAPSTTLERSDSSTWNCPALFATQIITPSDLHSAHKPLNCSVSHAQRSWGL